MTKHIVQPYLAFWAGVVRRTRKPMVIGITGSVGKSTTTAMVAAMLKHPEARRIVGTVVETRDNKNNHWGLPLTILRRDLYFPGKFNPRLSEVLRLPFRALLAPDYPDVLVLELGAIGKGDLQRLSRQALPSIGVVTTIGPGHLSQLGTVEGVADEKAAVVRWTSPSGLVVLGEGHDYVDRLRRQARAPVVTVGGRGIDLARNIARTIGRHLGIPEAAIEEALADPELPHGRLDQFRVGDITLIDDSYNANPLSMKLGLDTLAAAACPRRVAVLGVMAELGADATRYHAEIGAYARTRADVVIGVGNLARGYEPDIWYPDAAACAEAIGGRLQAGDCVLVKGSASAKMSDVAARLRQIDREDPSAVPVAARSPTPSDAPPR